LASHTRCLAFHVSDLSQRIRITLPWS